MRRAAALALLLAIACAQPDTREPALARDLTAMRKAIADFRAANKRGPYSLSELKTAHYLRDIPIDPMTGSRNWRVTTEQAVQNDDFGASAAPAAEPEIVDVHSRAPGKDSRGKPYADY